MNNADEWVMLQDTWASTASAAVPDVMSMIARARRQRQLILWTIVAEWAIVVLGGTIMVARWPHVQTDGLLTLWWVFFALIICTVLGITTWTRLIASREPAGASLRDWLRLRRHRALLGLRLARVTRWTTIAMLPAPLVALLTPRSGFWTAAAVVAVALLLIVSWIWAGRQTARLTREIAEVDALALEWLAEPLGSSGQPAST